MQIENRVLVQLIKSQRRRKAARGVILRPSLGNIEVRHIAHVEHLQEADGGGHHGPLGGHVQTHTGQVEGK